LDPPWDAVRDEYMLHFRDGTPGRPEWDAVIAATWLDKVQDAWRDLISACTAYLHST
jgi:hypothetical protein